MLIRIQDSEETTLLSEVEAAPAFFAGDIHALSVADVLSLLNTGRKSGSLLFELEEGVRKRLFLTDGEITFASSNAPEDRIGEVLWRAGVIDQQQLQQAAEMVRPGFRIGDALVAIGAVSPVDIYQGLIRQVRDIVLSLFSRGAGRFLFVSDANEGADQLQLGESTHELILAGLRGLQDIEQLRAAVPLHLVFERRSTLVDTRLTAHEVAVMDLVDGVRTAEEILKDSQLGEQVGLQTLHSLAQARLIVQRKAAAAAAARLDAGVEVAHDALAAQEADHALADLFDGTDELFADDEGSLDDDESSIGASPIDFASSETQEDPSKTDAAAATEAGAEVEPEVEWGEAAATEAGGEVEPQVEWGEAAATEAGGEVEPEVAARGEPTKHSAPAAPATSEARVAHGKDASGEALPAAAGAPMKSSPLPEEEDPEATRMPFAAYSKVVMRIYAILRKARKDPEALASYLEKPPEVYAPLFEGVRLVRGRLDMSRVLANARHLYGDQYKGRVLEALEALQSFVLFQAKNSLPPDVSRKVQRLVMLIHLGKA